MTKNVAKIARVFAALALPYFAGVAISLANGEMLGSEILNIEGDATYGEYLAGECVVCHRAGSRIPSLENVDKAFFLSMRWLGFSKECVKTLQCAISLHN